MSSSAAALKLLDLIYSHRVTAVIYVAAKLGIADLLSSGPRSLDEIVKATGADREALARLLAALVTTGICARADQDRYALGETGAALVGDACCRSPRAVHALHPAIEDAEESEIGERIFCRSSAKFPIGRPPAF